MPIDPSNIFSLYLVTRRGALSLEEFFRIIRASVEGGIKLVQLREKEISAREMIAIGKRLLSFLKPLGIPLIINDRVDVAHAVNADGVHVGQADLTVAEARAILGQKALIGLSVESLEQAVAATRSGCRLPGSKSNLSYDEQSRLWRTLGTQWLKTALPGFLSSGDCHWRR